MSQQEKRRATRKAPRTQIEDLPPPVEELSEEEASLAAGGLVYVTPQNVTLLGPALLPPVKTTRSSTFNPVTREWDTVEDVA